jgi:hypothetical protein
MEEENDEEKETDISGSGGGRTVADGMLSLNQQRELGRLAGNSPHSSCGCATDIAAEDDITIVFNREQRDEHAHTDLQPGLTRRP